MLVVDNKEAFEKAENVIDIIRDKHKGIKIKVFTFLLDSENYTRYKQYSNESQAMSQAMIRKYMPTQNKVIF